MPNLAMPSGGAPLAPGPAATWAAIQNQNTPSSSNPYAGLGNLPPNVGNILNLTAPPQNFTTVGDAFNANPGGFAQAIQNILHSGGSSAPAPAAPAPDPIAQLLQQMMGGGGQQAPTISNPNPAPAMSDFWNASPYQQEINQLAAGGKTGAAQTKAAYQQAIQQTQQFNALMGQQAKQNVGQAQNEANQMNSASNAALAQAEAQAAPGAAAAGGLPQEAAIQQQNNERGVQNAQFFQNMMAQNGTNNLSGLSAAQAGSLGLLNANVAAAQGKVTNQESADYTKAQQAYAAAMKDWNDQNFTAQVDNATAAKDAASTSSSDTLNAIKAMVALQSANPTYTSAQDVKNYVNNSMSGAEQNVANVVFNGIPGASGASAGFAGAPKDAQTATQRLQTLQAQGGISSAQAQAISSLIQTYFSGNTKLAALGANGQPQSGMTPQEQAIISALVGNSGLSS